MTRVTLFAEDYGHHSVVEALIHRLAREADRRVKVEVRSATRGHPAVLRELGLFMRDVESGRVRRPDCLVVATDANCKGVPARRRAVREKVGNPGVPVVLAIPDPHVERWLLLDSHAFKEVFGKGCSAPDHKCEKDRYKELLNRAIREAGGSPALGGLEFAEDLVASMDLTRLERADTSLGAFLADMRLSLNQLD